jgi:DNA-binding HxlR family transcriptional regulator
VEFLTEDRTGQFPYELCLAIEGLDNDYRQRILYSLKNVDKLSFSEIREAVDIETPLLSSHLRKLTESLLVEHFYEHTLGDEKYSFYRISKFGKSVLESLLRALNKETYEAPDIFRVEINGSSAKPSSVQTEIIVQKLVKDFSKILKANSSSDGQVLAKIAGV